MKLCILFVIFLCLNSVFMFGEVNKKIIFEESYEEAVLSSKKAGKNLIIIVGTDLKDKLIKNFIKVLKDDTFLERAREKNIFLVIDKNNKIFNDINLAKSPTIFWIDVKNEQIKLAYVGDIKDSDDFDKEFLSHVLEPNYKNMDKKTYHEAYEINTLDDEIFFYKTLNNEWYLKFNNEDRKLSLHKTSLKEFLVFEDIKNSKLYAIPKSRAGNIYFSDTNNEEWKFFGKIN